MHAIKDALTGHKHKHDKHVAPTSSLPTSSTALPTTSSQINTSTVAPASTLNQTTTTSVSRQAVQNPPLKETVSTTARTVAEAPVTVRKQVLAPTVNEVRRTVETEVVQPHVDVTRSKTQIEQVIQPIMDKKVMPTQHVSTIDQAQEVYRGSAQMSEADRRRYEQATHMQGRVVDAGIEHRTIQAPAVVHERKNMQVKQEVIPVIEREVVIPRVIHHEKPVHEHIIEPTTLTQTTAAPITLQQAQQSGIPVATTGLTNQMSNLNIAPNTHLRGDAARQAGYDTSSPSSSSDEERRQRRLSGQPHESLGQKVKRKLGKQHAHNNLSTTSSTLPTSSNLMSAGPVPTSAAPLSSAPLSSVPLSSAPLSTGFPSNNLASKHLQPTTGLGKFDNNTLDNRSLGTKVKDAVATHGLTSNSALGPQSTMYNDRRL